MHAAYDHCGFVVTDIAAAVSFFIGELGATEVRRGRLVDVDGSSMTDIFGVSPRAELSFVFVALGEIQIELLAWSDATASSISPATSDAGGRHLALRVPDLEATVSRLRKREGFVVRERSERGFHYVKTPFGLELQLFEG